MPTTNIVPGAQTIDEDTALPIAGVSVTDTGGTTLTTTLSVLNGTLHVTDGTGVVTNDTASVTIAGTQAEINTALAGLSYTGGLDFNGSDTLTVTSDDGITPDTDTVAITVTAVNDPPVNTVPGAQTVAEDTALPIAGVSVADVDSATLTTTLAVLNGTLHVTDGTGVSSNDSASVTIIGTQADINAALAGLSYTGNPLFSGSDTLTVTTGDGIAQDTDTVAITVSPVNHEPTANPDTASVAANASVTGNVLTNDTDPDNDPLNVSSVDQGVNLVGQPIAGKYGTLTLNADGSYTYTADNSAPPGAPVTDTFTYTVTDHHGGSDALFASFDAPDYALGSINGQQGWSVTGAYDQSIVSDGSGQGLHFTRQVTSGGFFDQLFSPALTQTAAEPSNPGTATSFFEASWTMTPQALEISAEAQNGFIGISMDHVSGVRGNLLRLSNDSSGNWVLHAFDYNHALGAFTDTAVAELPVGVATTIGFTQQFVDGPGNDIWNVYVNDQLVFTGTGWEDFIRDSGDPSPVGYEKLLFRASGNTVIGDQGVIIDNVSFSTNQESTLTVSVQGNSAPVNTVPGAQTVDEDITLPIAGVSVTDAESAALTTTLSVLNGTLHVTDGTGVVANDSASVTIAGTQAEINAALAGLSYTGSLDFNGSDTLTVTTNDGIAQDADTVAITVNPVNDAPMVGAPLALAPIDVDSGAHVITQAALLANANDVDGPSLTAINLQISKGLGTLADNHDGTWTYTPQIGDDSSVNFAYQVTDGVAAPVADSATLDFQSTQSAPVIGTPGDDTFTAGAGNSAFDALGGVDTINFGFKLTEATVTYVGNQVIIDAPGSHTVLTGFEVFKFTDGTVNNNDANPLVDDLFYYSHYHDVWNAHADAELHYDVYGWKEGRDPNLYFDTDGYLAHYADVKAAGIDPLVHYDQVGWKEGRDPSVNFDTKHYLAAYPDVAAAHVDPLAHFLQYGLAEGRSAFSDGVWG